MAILREPTSRVVSGFWYSGLGCFRDRTASKVPEDLTLWQRKMNTAQALGQWMADGPDLFKPTDGGALPYLSGAYVPNTQLRTFTGHCGQDPPKVGDSGAAFDKTCPYEHQVPISEAELQRAIGILEQFNLVNITEFLNDKVYVDYLAATLHLPLATKKLSRTRGNEPLAIAPEGTVLNKIKDENKLDTRLYEWGRNKTRTLALEWLMVHYMDDELTRPYPYYSGAVMRFYSRARTVAGRTGPQEVQSQTENRKHLSHNSEEKTQLLVLSFTSAQNPDRKTRYFYKLHQFIVCHVIRGVKPPPFCPSEPFQERLS